MQNQPSWLERHHILVAIILYSILAILMTLPLAFNFTTHIPGVDSGDGPLFLWNAWWFQHALTTDAPFMFSDIIFAPDGADLLYQTKTYVHDAVIALLTPLFGLVASFNIVFLFSIIATAFGTYLLTLYLTGNKRAAFLAGVLFAFSPIIMLRSWGVFNLFAVWPIPWFMLFYVRYLERQRWRTLFAAAIVLGLAIYNGFFMPVFIAILVGMMLVIFILREKVRRRQLGKILFGTAGIFFLALVLASPLITQYVTASAHGNTPVVQSPEYQYSFSADPLFYLTPGKLHPLIPEPPGSVYNGKVWNYIYIGYTTLALVVLALVLFIRHSAEFRRRTLSHPLLWLGAGGLTFLLSLGPTLKLPGGGEIFLPYYGMSLLPFFEHFRAPERMSILVAFTFALASGIGLAYAFRSRRLMGRPGIIVFGGILALVLFDFLPAPLWMADVRIPPVITQIPQTTRTVLHIPTTAKSAWNLAGKGRAHISLYHFYQSEHQRPIIGGYLSRVPDERFTSLLETPGYRFLTTYPALDDIHQEFPVHADDFVPQLVQDVFRGDEIDIILFERAEVPDAALVDRYVTTVVGAEWFAEDERFTLYTIPQSSEEPGRTTLVEQFFPTEGDTL